MLRKVAVAVLTFACAAPMVGAQTVDEIVAKNIEAHGGAAKIKAIQSMKEHRQNRDRARHGSARGAIPEASRTTSARNSPSRA